MISAPQLSPHSFSSLSSSLVDNWLDAVAIAAIGGGDV
jgi:hypothetical protein